MNPYTPPCLVLRPTQHRTEVREVLEGGRRAASPCHKHAPPRPTSVPHIDHPEAPPSPTPILTKSTLGCRRCALPALHPRVGEVGLGASGGAHGHWHREGVARPVLRVDEQKILLERRKVRPRALVVRPPLRVVLELQPRLHRRAAVRREVLQQRNKAVAVRVVIRYVLVVVLVRLVDVVVVADLDHRRVEHLVVAEGLLPLGQRCVARGVHRLSNELLLSERLVQPHRVLWRRLLATRAHGRLRRLRGRRRRLPFGGRRHPLLLGRQVPRDRHSFRSLKPAL
mmetsp:Transcript_8501/g.27458  ORF Transcript_8501/g.27458 Transcript_8501/m.27458 type:complete len:283 (+) Transcript_8501:35-883(+)